MWYANRFDSPQMTSFQYRSNAELPGLSWCLSMDARHRQATVWHGSLLEIREKAFVEGAWDGPWAQFNFDRSELLMGTGCRLTDTGVVVATSSHTLEPLYTIRIGEKLYASNSLVFLLQAAGHTLTVAHIHYHTDLASIVLGTKDCVKNFPTAEGGQVRLHYFTNLLVQWNLNLVRQTKPVPAEFADFESYRAYLSNGLRRIFENARCDARRVKFAPVMVASSGYDSVASAVLAREAGCRRAVTVAKLKPDGADDSFKSIGTALGYDQVQEYSYADYAAVLPFSEAEVFASGSLSLDRFNLFEKACRQRVVITGVYGDVAWDINNARGGDFRGKPLYLGGANALTEFRLRAGSIVLPLPYFGALRHASIHRVSNSAEMEPWRVGGKYDRPIARRIAEEAGINRSLFGTTKRGIGIGVSYFPKRMNPESYSSLLEYCNAHKHKRSSMREVGYWFLYLTCVALKVLRLRLRIPVPQVIPFRYVRSPGLASYMIPWGVELISARYRGELTPESDHLEC